MRPGPRNTVADVAGVSVGHAADAELKSGVTVCLADGPMVAGVHVMGGAPGTRETDLMRPDALVDRVDALVLSGGSALGLAAADGVAARLRDRGRGFAVDSRMVPIVPAAILYDLDAGGDHGWRDNPYPDLGRAALDAAGPDVALGAVGAGTGATCGRLKGGIGSASAVLSDGTTVAALVAVNAMGGACHPETGRFWAAPWEIGDEFGGHGPSPDIRVQTKAAFEGQNTTIAVIVTDATLDKASATRLATVAHDGMARALVPSHTPFDGDLVFAASTGARAAPDPAGLLWLGHAAATCLARAIARGVHAARPAPGDALPAWHQRFG